MARVAGPQRRARRRGGRFTIISTSPTVESMRTVGSPFMTARAGGARRGSRSTPDLARRGLLRLVSGALEHGQPGVLVEARIDAGQGAAPEHAALGLDAPGMPAGEAQPYPRAPESVSGVIGQATSPRRDRRMSMCPSSTGAALEEGVRTRG